MAIYLSNSEISSILSPFRIGTGVKSVEGLEFDTRLIRLGQLFVALPGSQVHGHSFIADAFQKGASAALVEDEGVFESSPYREKLILVGNTLEAMGKLASFWREKFTAPILAVTGSVGKTTTKEMCAAILSKGGRGSFSRKSFNNHIGVPYTVANLNLEDRWAVLEMGMNHPGELAELTKIARPDAVLITCIAPVHIEFFESLAEIADAKCEILNSMRNGSIVILNAEDRELLAGYDRWKAKNSGTKLIVKHFGYTQGADLTVSKVAPLGYEGSRFELSLQKGTCSITMPILGKHNALNAGAAALAAQSVMPGLKLAEVKEALEQVKAPSMRLNLLTLPNGKRVIDDSYNASPASMRASLELLMELKKPGEKVAAILGDMLELGKHSPEYHSEIGDLVGSLKPDLLITVGKDSGLIASQAEKQGVHALKASDPEAAAQAAIAEGFDLLLVKGSRGIGLDRAVSGLKV